MPLEFKIVNKVFDNELQNQSSSKYINLKIQVEDEMTKVYKAKFNNFKKVTVTGFSNGSVVVTSVLEFETTTQLPAPSSDNTVRALISSLQSNNSVGGFELAPNSISSNNISQANLPPLNISVNFLIMAPYNASPSETLRNQTIAWVQNVLLELLNGTEAAKPNITFTDNGGWTYTTANFFINSTNLLNETTALNNLIAARGNAGFSIVPGTLTVDGKNLTFNITSLSLGILNLSPSSDLIVKSSNAFQTNAAAIRKSFTDIFGQQPEDVGPVVNTFTNDPLPVTASVDLYFLNVSINKTSVVKRIINNWAIFSNRSIVLDLFSLDPTAVVQVKFTLIQNYISSLSNMSSSESVALQNSLLNLLTPNMQNIFNNSLQTPPSVTFQNVDVSAATVIQYVRNFTVNVDSAQVIKSLEKNSNLTSLVRIASLNVNNVMSTSQVFIFYPRFTNIMYTSDLNDRNSQRFKQLEQNVTNALSSILTNFNLAQIVVDSFMPGSVISKVEMIFPQGATTSTAVAQQIVNNQNILQNYNLTLDPQSIYVPGATFPPTENSFPGYAVAIIVMSILAILCIPVCIILSLKTDMCLKLRRAFTLKPPYEHVGGVSVLPGATSYRSHSYELPH